MESFKLVTLWCAAAGEAAAVLAIGIGVIEAVLRTLGIFVRQGSSASAARSHHAKEEIRLRLGRWLALGLEFLLAADILRTAVAPTWNEIGQLGAIVVLRTFLNYFLQIEIDKADARERATAGEVQPGLPR